MISISKNDAQAIATRIAMRDVDVTPFFGKVGNITTNPDVYTQPKLTGYSPLDFSCSWELGNQVNFNSTFPGFIAEFEVWRLPTTMEIDCRNCNVPAVYAIEGAEQYFRPQNAALIGGKWLTFIPRGTTTSSITGAEFTGVRAWFYMQYNIFEDAPRFMYVTNDVYIGTCIYSAHLAYKNDYSSSSMYPAFINPANIDEFITYGLDLSSIDAVSGYPAGKLSCFGVFNAFSNPELQQNLFGGGNPVDAELAFAPFVFGYKFNLLKSDGLTQRYLIQAVAP